MKILFLPIWTLTFHASCFTLNSLLSKILSSWWTLPRLRPPHQAAPQSPPHSASLRGSGDYFRFRKFLKTYFDWFSSSKLLCQLNSVMEELNIKKYTCSSSFVGLIPRCRRRFPSSLVDTSPVCASSNFPNASTNSRMCDSLNIVNSCLIHSIWWHFTWATCYCFPSSGGRVRTDPSSRGPEHGWIFFQEILIMLLQPFLKTLYFWLPPPPYFPESVTKNQILDPFLSTFRKNHFSHLKSSKKYNKSAKK